MSYSRDVTFDPNDAHFVLYTGGRTGVFTIHAMDKQTGSEVTSADFSVTDAWSGNDGPPLRVIGAAGNPSVVFAGTGTRKVAIVVLETTDVDSQLEEEQEALRNGFADEIFNGVEHNGVLESSAAYLNEVSNGRLTLENAAVVGTLRLPNSWDDYNLELLEPRNIWKGIVEFSKAGVAELLKRNQENAASGLAPLVDLATVDSIVFVVRSFPDSTGATRSVWPWATQSSVLSLSFDIDGDPLTPDRQIETVVLPTEWVGTLADGTHRVRYTVAHELCHNMGLGDQYPLVADDSPIKPRDITEWSLMSDGRKFPELSSAERRILGWIDDAAIKTLPTPSASAVVDETVKLKVVSRAPGFNEFTAVEIPRNGTSSYMLELRSKQNGMIGDQNHTPTVFGVDWSATDTDISVRPQLLRMRNDADSDRGIYRAGGDYVEEETDKPEYPVDLRIEVVSISADTAQLRIRYGDQKPDPQLAPLSVQNHYQSPDITVSNDRSRANLALANIPWADRPNTITAHVHNVGNFDAPLVRVEFWWADFTVSLNSAFQFLGAAMADVAAGGTTDIDCDVPWVPPVGSSIFSPIPRAHYCVKAEITDYKVPDTPEIVEITTTNNVAQSNYGTFYPGWASPTSREATTVIVEGSERRDRHYITATQTSDFARTFIDSAWVDVDPGERREIDVFTEFMVGDNTIEDYVNSIGGVEAAVENPNHLLLSSAVLTGCAANTRGGASVLVPVGIRTHFTNLTTEPGTPLVLGSVRTISGAASSGEVIVGVRPVGSPTRGGHRHSPTQPW